jgi:hypothetical protein
MPEPLSISEHWGELAEDRTDQAPLISLSTALETSWLRQGIRRDAFLGELLKGLHQRRLVPLLAMLPRGWRLAPAALPERLRGIGSLLEQGLVSPLLLGALADDLQHLIPHPQEHDSHLDGLDRWCARDISTPAGVPLPLPQSLQGWQDLARQLDEGDQDSGTESLAGPLPEQSLGSLGAGLVWRNHGLQALQNGHCRSANRVMAQVFNALGANGLPSRSGAASEPYQFEGMDRPRQLVAWLQQHGWHCRGRIRASVASFGLGASCPSESGVWQQVPLAVPYRTGLMRHGLEIESLLPHCSLELELQAPEEEAPVLMQYYQGTEGLNGWAPLNDLERPWQNDRQNGTVAYPGEAFEDDQLGLALDLCDLMAAVHNSTASDGHLRFGGYGALGFCIDSTALLEQAMTGRSNLFPLTLGGLWRERLGLQLEKLLDAGLRPGQQGDQEDVVSRYRQALEQLPQDLSVQGEACIRAEARLIRCQPRHSPFLSVRRLNGELM